MGRRVQTQLTITGRHRVIVHFFTDFFMNIQAEGKNPIVTDASRSAIGEYLSWSAFSSVALGCVLAGHDLSGFYECESTNMRDELRLTKEMLSRFVK